LTDPLPAPSMKENGCQQELWEGYPRWKLTCNTPGLRPLWSFLVVQKSSTVTAQTSLLCSTGHLKISHCFSFPTGSFSWGTEITSPLLDTKNCAWFWEWEKNKLCVPHIVSRGYELVVEKEVKCKIVTVNTYRNLHSQRSLLVQMSLLTVLVACKIYRDMCIPSSNRDQ
jgi:hypothetical protein